MLATPAFRIGRSEPDDEDKKSAIRPPHPVSGSATVVALSHWADPATWLRSDAGTRLGVCRSCVLVAGVPSGPTFATKRAFLLLYKLAMLLRAGCNPKKALVVPKERGRQRPCGRASDGRSEAYWLYPPVSKGMSMLLPSLPPTRVITTTAL